MNSHLSTNWSNSLFLPFQSAYRSFHSTESTVLKIHNDIISSIDNGEVTALILFDLSAAFDTVDHSILLSRLKNWFGFEDSCLSWFSSYLNLRKQAVSLKDTISSYFTSSCGVPDHKDPFSAHFFSPSIRLLGSVISRNSLKYHLYADDTQIYISFKPADFHQSSDILLQPSVTLFPELTATNSC